MNKYNRPIKEICQANSKFNIIQQKSQTTSSCSAAANRHQFKEGKVSKKHQKSKQKKYSPPMDDDHNKNLRNLYKNHIGSLNIERQQQLLDKENYLKLYNCNNEKNMENNNSSNNNISNNISHGGGLAYNDRNHPDDDTGSSGRCLQDDLEQEQSIFCNTYNQYHTVNSNLSNISVKIHSGNTTVNSNNNNNISKMKS